MSETVIKAENLYKEYRIGSRERYKTFRETLLDAVKSPFVGNSNISPKSETIWALKDVSFEVRHGEIVGIIGRNGAGKTTLLKILSKITQPTTGRIELKGRVGSLLEVGIGFHPELTGHENVYLYGAILGMDRWEVTRKFDEIVAFAELEKFVDTPVKRYSSGMYMRLAFAVAAHLEPEILLVDEVLAVGDAAFQKKCLGKMENVSKEGRTVLFVSHNMGAISSLCDSALLLENGTKVFEGPAQDTIKKYMDGAARIPAQWIPPIPAGGESVSIVSVRVKDIDGQTRSEFTNQEPIIVELQLKIKEWMSDLKVGFELEGQFGSTVFTTFHNDINNPIEKNKFKKGIYGFVAILPPRLFNSSTYFVSPCIGLHRKRWIIREERVVQFNVRFQIDNVAFFVGRRKGIISPLIEWRVSYAD